MDDIDRRVLPRAKGSRGRRERDRRARDSEVVAVAVARGKRDGRSEQARQRKREMAAGEAQPRTAGTRRRRVLCGQSEAPAARSRYAIR